MEFITKRALYYSFATCVIEQGDATKIWYAVAELFGITPEELARSAKFPGNPVCATLKTVEDVRLLQKCAVGFGNAFKLTADDEEVLELKYQSLIKIKQLTSEYKTTPLKAVAAAYHRDSTAAVLYALQIFMHNKGRHALGCEILHEALFTGQNGDAGILLLNAKHGDKEDICSKLAETPEMILHPEVLAELAKAHGINLATVQRDSARIGF